MREDFRGELELCDCEGGGEWADITEPSTGGVGFLTIEYIYQLQQSINNNQLLFNIKERMFQSYHLQIMKYVLNMY